MPMLLDIQQTHHERFDTLKRKMKRKHTQKKRNSSPLIIRYLLYAQEPPGAIGYLLLIKEAKVHGCSHSRCLVTHTRQEGWPPDYIEGLSTFIHRSGTLICCELCSFPQRIYYGNNIYIHISSFPSRLKVD